MGSVIFARRSSTADVINAMSGSFSASIRVMQGRPEPVKVDPDPGWCDCGHPRGAHDPMKRNRPAAFGCRTCLCLTTPNMIERDPRERGYLSATAWANFAAAVGAEGMGGVFAQQAERMGYQK